MIASTLAPRLAVLAGAAIALPQLFACLAHPVKEVAYDKTGIGTKGVAIAVNKDVDILFVIDDSGSMAEEQALLAKNFGAFIGVLEAPDIRANYRIGITTTDSGNPRCSKADTTPPAGDLLLSSCLDRTGDFLFNGTDPPTDATYACTDVCAKSGADLEILPTTTERDPVAKPRPWLESLDGRTNLPEGVSTLEAFQCFGPQGVSGCGFESHLESMYRALTKADTPGEANYGFLRDSAILSVVILTDELDCSYNEAHKVIFTPDNKVFWNSPDDPIPTSAVCMRAGVECIGDGDPAFEDCYAQDYDEAGNPGASAADAVLHPVGRYVDYLKGIEAAKQKEDSGQEVLVALIGGVPAGYEDGGEIIYSGVGDPSFIDDFGVAPGCVLGDGKAAPPVRLREFAEAFQIGDEQHVLDLPGRLHQGARGDRQADPRPDQAGVHARVRQGHRSGDADPRPGVPDRGERSSERPDDGHPRLRQERRRVGPARRRDDLPRPPRRPRRHHRRPQRRPLGELPGRGLEPRVQDRPHRAGACRIDHHRELRPLRHPALRLPRARLSREGARPPTLRAPSVLW